MVAPFHISSKPQQASILHVCSHCCSGSRSFHQPQPQPQPHARSHACSHAALCTCLAGSTVDASKEPLFAGLLEQCPVQLYGGLPAPTRELRWAPGVEVHLLGAYAALELGPGALNLAGGCWPGGMHVSRETCLSACAVYRRWCSVLDPDVALAATKVAVVWCAVASGVSAALVPTWVAACACRCAHCCHQAGGHVAQAGGKG